ncbi:hypothetical protein [Dactylosporangium sp. NPDC000521]|uniref:hypothetical protein n=1 Tax=Dactylosporangium sp. NPDC000521 TaxID=3363975 RepID=UPI00367BBC92
MLSTPEPPQLEPDAYQQQITPEPASAEYGAHTFGRQITSGLQRLLGTPVDPPSYRCNPTDRRPCPTAQEYTFTAAGHQVVITCFEATHPLRRGTMPAYAIHLDGQRLPFEPYTYRDVDRQLARTVWIAITDLQFAAERDASPAAEAAPGEAGPGVAPQTAPGGAR